jgi:hypothetical protein
MSGAKTRFGFAGNGSEPPEDDESRTARTVLGHDIHLRAAPGQIPSESPPMHAYVPRTPLPPPPMLRPAIPPPPRLPASPGRVMAAVADERTDQIRARRQARPPKSRLARFLGRWTTGGHFRSNSHLAGTMRLDELGNSVYRVPRDTTGRNVILVLVVALLTFIITFAIVRTRTHAPAPAPAFPTVQAPAPVGAPSLPAAMPASPSPTPPPAPAPVQLAAPAASPKRPLTRVPLLGSEARPVATPAKTTVQATPRPPTPNTRPGHSAPYAAEPPAHLKGELLPIRP